jgi:uncharacterized protein (TIGR00369 family)
MTTIEETLYAQLRKNLPNMEGLELPPRIFKDMEGEFIGWDEQIPELVVRFPVRERYQNPLGVMQGGMVVAAIDNAFGPLAFLVAPPSLTMQLNTSFIKSVAPGEVYIEVTARVELLTKRFLYMSASVTSASGEVLAISQANCMILRGARA